MNSRLIKSQSASDHSDFEDFFEDFNDIELSLSFFINSKSLESPPYSEYISWKEALTAVNRWAKSRDYVIIEDRVKYRVQGDLIIIRKKWLVYNRYGKPNFTVNFDMRIRQDRGCIKINCKIKVTVT